MKDNYSLDERLNLTPDVMTTGGFADVEQPRDKSYMSEVQKLTDLAMGYASQENSVVAQTPLAPAESANENFEIKLAPIEEVLRIGQVIASMRVEAQSPKQSDFDLAA